MQNYNIIKRILTYFHDDLGGILAKNLQIEGELSTLKEEEILPVKVGLQAKTCRKFWNPRTSE